MKRIIFVITFCLMSLPTYSLDTELTVLGVRLNGADPVQAGTYLNSIRTLWPSSVGSPIKLANNGIPVSLSSSTLGSSITQLTNAENALQSTNLRETHSADIVIFFTTSFSEPDVCGLAPMDFWINSPGAQKFTPVASDNGLDRRGKDSFFTGIVAASDSGCTVFGEVAIHEFAHLFGAAHEVNSDTPSGTGVLPDSHAYIITTGQPFIPITRRSIMASTLINTFGFVQDNVFSSTSGSTNNLAALQQTALSVANYRTTPACNPAPPTNVIALQTGICAPPPYTRYIMTWNDNCPGDTDFYQVFASQPTGTPFTFRFSTLIPSTPVFVSGASANAKIRSCDGGACTALSSSTAFVPSLCNF